MRNLLLFTFYKFLLLDQSVLDRYDMVSVNVGQSSTEILLRDKYGNSPEGSFDAKIEISSMRSSNHDVILGFTNHKLPESDGPYSRIESWNFMRDHTYALDIDLANYQSAPLLEAVYKGAQVTSGVIANGDRDLTISPSSLNVAGGTVPDRTDYAQLNDYAAHVIDLSHERARVVAKYLGIVEERQGSIQKSGGEIMR